MKAQCRFGLVLPWSRVTAVFLVDVLILVVASHCPDSWQAHHRVAWWVGVGVAAVVMLLAVVSYRGITMVSGLVTWLWNWSADPETVLGAGCTPAIDYQRRFGWDTVGVREYQGQLVTVIAIDGGESDPSGRYRHRTLSAVVAVRSVAKGLRQFDIHLDAIDIVSVQVRDDGSGADVAALEEWGLEQWGAGQTGVSEDRLVQDRRSTWLVLRMNPQRNVAAVVTRDSLASTLVAATERLARDLDGQSCAARPLTADELTEVDRALLAGLEPTWRCPGWRHLKYASGYATSFWVTPSAITSETLDQLWSDNPEVRGTVTTVQITTSGGRLRLSAWVRYHSANRLPKQVWAGLNRLTGRQLAAVRANLPVPAIRPWLVVPSRDLRHNDELVLSVGQMRESTTNLPTAQ